MTDNAQVLPPEASASDMVNLDDASFSKLMGLKEVAGEETSAADAASEEAAPTEEVVEEVAAPEGEQAAVEGEAEAEPEQEEEPAPVAKRQPLTKYAVFEGEEEVELPDGLEVTYEANGKVRKVPIDKLVQMAQMGHYNHEKQQEIRETAEKAQLALQEREQLAAAVRQFQQYYDKMFLDPEFYDTAREAYLKEQTPEAQVKRERQALEAQKAQFSQQQEAAYVAQVVETRLTPALMSLVQDNPTVSQDEVLGLYTRLTAPLLDRGRLPASKMAEVISLVERDLAYQVRGLHEERAEAEAKKQRALHAEKGKTVAAKRQIARTAAPKGASVPDTPKPKQYESANDWFANDPLLKLTP